MLLNGKSAGPLRVALIVVALAGSGVFLLRSSPAKPVAVQAAEQRLDSAERERDAVAARASVVVARAAEARAAAKPALAQVESLRSRVTVERAGELRVLNTGAAASTTVPVPALVTERIKADSAAISALSVALIEDSRAAAAQDELLVVEAKARDAARLTIAQLERERHPKCGRRCGMLLGAASIVALGIALNQTRRLLAP
jgi:hypothetical protein